MWINRFLVPQKTCLLCHDRFAVQAPSCLCPGCLNDVRQLYHNEQRCPTCAQFSIDGSICGTCQQRPSTVQQFWASALYAAPIPSLLHEFKHLNQIHCGQILAQIMLDNPPKWLSESQIDGILPMPLSQKRRVYRGFNQCDELANAITQRYKIPIFPHQHIFRQHKDPQSTLKAKERSQNVRGQFRLNFNVKNRKVLIIDDVSTTGASIFELARTLQKSGAAAIFAWVVARNL